MTRFAIGPEMRHFQGVIGVLPRRRCSTACSPTNEPISNNSSVSKRLCTYRCAAGLHPIVPPSPMARTPPAQAPETVVTPGGR